MAMESKMRWGCCRTNWEQQWKWWTRWRHSWQSWKSRYSGARLLFTSISLKPDVSKCLLWCCRWQSRGRGGRGWDLLTSRREWVLQYPLVPLEETTRSTNHECKKMSQCSLTDMRSSLSDEDTPSLCQTVTVDFQKCESYRYTTVCLWCQGST